MEVAYTAYFEKLKTLPEKLNITNPTLRSFIVEPINSITGVYSSIVSYVKTMGIVLGVVIALFILTLILPLFEAGMIFFRLLKTPINIWLNSIKRVLSNMGVSSYGMVDRRRKYWEDAQKLV